MIITPKRVKFALFLAPFAIAASLIGGIVNPPAQADTYEVTYKGHTFTVVPVGDNIPERDGDYILVDANNQPILIVQQYNGKLGTIMYVGGQCK